MLEIHYDQDNKNTHLWLGCNLPLNIYSNFSLDADLVGVGQGLTRRLPTKFGANHFAPIMRFWLGIFHAPHQTHNSEFVHILVRMLLASNTRIRPSALQFVGAIMETTWGRLWLYHLHSWEEKGIQIQIQCESMHSSLLYLLLENSLYNTIN